MGRRPIPRALAGVALGTLVLSAPLTAPSLAQAPSPVPSTAPATSPLPAPSPTRTPIPTGTPPAAVPTAAPRVPGSPSTSAPSGGPTAINASQIPSLPPADQTSPLPYPAYGTPSPVTPGAPPPSGVPQVITLQQATLIAYAQSPTLALARAAVEIARAPVLTARAGQLPTITGDVSSTYTHRQNAANGNASNTTFAPNQTTNALTASLRQLIFDGGRVAALIRQANANENSSLATYQRSLQTVAFNVATAYYNALSAERQVQVSLATVRLDQVQENLVSAQIRAGTAARADLATAQLATAQARVAVIRAQATAFTQLAAFANALGLDANVYVQPKDDVGTLSVTTGALNATPAFPTPSYDQALARAYALRPDLASAEQTLAAAQSGLRAAKLGLFPNLNLASSYGTTSTGVGGGSFRNTGSAGLTLSIPIFDAGLTHAQVVQAQGVLDQANATVTNTRNTVQLNVRQALVTLVSAYAAVNQANQELSTAQIVLRSTEAQYAAGVTTLPLLLNAQTGITTALTDITTSVYAVRQAEQNLLFAEGANGAG